MHGTLESPPVIIRTDRRKALLRLAAVALLAAVLSPVTRTHWQVNALAWLVIVLFSALAAASAWELIRPSRLIISPDGLLQRDLWRSRRWSWRDVRNFQPASNRFHHFVGFDRTRSSEPRAATVGQIEGLNQDWELPPPALARLLNRARERWVGADRGL